MRKLVLSILALAVAQTAQLLAQTPSKEGSATITGRVLLKGEPASGVSVGLQPQPQSPSGAPYVPDRSKYLRAKTDNEGRFQFTGLAAGQYRILALAPGFVSSSDSPYATGKTLNIKDGENVENVELTIRRGAVITGRVIDPSGAPVVEKDVQLLKMDERGNFRRIPNIGGGYDFFRTDDRGIYRVHSLPAGKYKVSFGHTPQEFSPMDMSRVYYPRTFHPDTTDEKQAKIIELSEGSEATDIDIKLSEAKKTYDVAGRVIEAETGQSVPGVRIGYGIPNQSGTVAGVVLSMTVSDTQGGFILQGVLPGKYLGYAATNFDQQSDFYSDQTPFEINDSDIAGVEIKVHRGGSISGVAVVEGSNDPAILSQLPRINLNLLYPGSGSVGSNRSAKPAANGGFRFSGLKPGKADIKAFTPAEGLKQARIEHNGAPVMDGFDIQPGEHITNVRVVFGYGSAVVRGQVRITGGAAPEGLTMSVRVKFLSGSGSEFAVPVDARGQFVLKNLIAGEYELRLFAYSPNRASEMVQLLERINKSTHRVTVGSGGETQTELVVDLSRKEGDK